LFDKQVYFQSVNPIDCKPFPIIIQSFKTNKAIMNIKKHYAFYINYFNKLDAEWRATNEPFTLLDFYFFTTWAND